MEVFWPWIAAERNPLANRHTKTGFLRRSTLGEGGGARRSSEHLWLYEQFFLQTDGATSTSWILVQGILWTTALKP